MIIGSVWCSRITCSPPTGQPPHNIILIFSASKHHALRELPAVVHGWQRGHRNVSGVGRRRRKKRGKKGFLPRCKGDCFGCDLSASAWYTRQKTCLLPRPPCQMMQVFIFILRHVCIHIYSETCADRAEVNMLKHPTDQ